MDCCGCRCNPFCRGIKLAVIGVVVILNQIYFRYDPWLLIGLLLVGMGILKMVSRGYCPCKESRCESTKASQAPKNEETAPKAASRPAKRNKKS
jgi:hypothetical protein